MFATISFRGEPPKPNGGCSSRQAGAIEPPQPDWFCHCLKIEGQAVQDEIVLRGARDIKAVQHGTKAGTGCMACVRRIHELLGKLVPPDPQTKRQPPGGEAGAGADGDAKIE